MCPVCWAALLAQFVFYISVGQLLVVLTDWKAGIPLTLGAAILALGNLEGWWSVPNEVLYIAASLAMARGVWIIFAAEQHWIRTLSWRVGGWTRRFVRPVFPKAASH